MTTVSEQQQTTSHCIVYLCWLTDNLLTAVVSLSLSELLLQDVVDPECAPSISHIPEPAQLLAPQLGVQAVCAEHLVPPVAGALRCPPDQPSGPPYGLQLHVFWGRPCVLAAGQASDEEVGQVVITASSRLLTS